ncbi:MAG TPA: aldo/keto reductase [Tahibacter sp.]|uniref:aldo/keto reductase n=1 Tax=Tahibacter sp. TaxID=2056211 RepID=UPI002BA765BA|nr:aldo/keto reductase [Tahibacter sp.]HSX59557.1 aldo/keto reductase [Tahibacter sp.]
MVNLTRRGFVAALGSSLILMPPLHRANAADALQRAIPRDGTPLPAIGLGTWQAFDFDAGDAAANAEGAQTLQRLLQQPRSVIDTSPMYGRAEAALGRLLKQHDPKQRSFVATKVWTHGRNEGRAQIEQSFERLGRDVIDLYQVHNLVDYATHLPTLQALKREGRVRYIGVTHYTKSAYADLLKTTDLDAIDFMQINYSLLEREAADAIFPAARRHRVGVIVNRPFAEGAVFRRTNGKPLPDWAAGIGCTSWAQFALKFILAQPAVTCAIPGTRNPTYLADNLRAASGPVPDADTARRMAAYFDAL